MSNWKYHEGDYLGKYNTLFIKRLSNDNHRGIFQCSFCGKEFESNIYQITSNHTTRCSECTFKRRSNLGKSKFKDISGQQYGSLIALEPTSKRQHGRIIWKCLCLLCNQHTYINANNWGRNIQCDKCAHEKDLTNQKYGKLTAIYKTDKKQNGFNVWHCKCDCGNECDLSVGDWGSTQSCGKCQCSHGENKIKEILDLLNIKYIQQYTFNNCINPETNRKLRFDFYLPVYNTCIEYDGEQHYFITYGWNDKEHLQQTQYRDKIKDQYCKDHNIKLLRIPYWNYKNIHQIITEEFDNNN